MIEQSILAVLLAVLGLALGSFLNVLVLRLNTGETLKGRSRCFSCLEQLRWYDLIPLLSFAVIWGRCRYCKTRISLQYPIVELLAAIVVVSIGFAISPITEPARFFVAILFFLTLLAISVYDFRQTIVPDQLAFVLTLAALLFEGINIHAGMSMWDLWLDFAPAFGAFSFFALIWLFSRGAWMGFGDAKVAFSLGLFLGYPGIILALYLAFLFGACIAILLMLFFRASRKMEVPFVPFLALGAFAAFLIIAFGAFAPYQIYLSIV